MKCLYQIMAQILTIQFTLKWMNTVRDSRRLDETSTRVVSLLTINSFSTPEPSTSMSTQMFVALGSQGIVKLNSRMHHDLQHLRIRIWTTIVWINLRSKVFLNSVFPYTRWSYRMCCRIHIVPSRHLWDSFIHFLLPLLLQRLSFVNKNPLPREQSLLVG